MPSKKVKLNPGDILQYDHNPDFLFEAVLVDEQIKLHYIKVPTSVRAEKGTISFFTKSFIEHNCTKISR